MGALGGLELNTQAPNSVQPAAEHAALLQQTLSCLHQTQLPHSSLGKKEKGQKSGQLELAVSRMVGERKFAEALSLLNAVLSERPSEPSAMHLLGFVYLAQGLNSQALPWLCQACLADPQNKTAWVHLALALNRLGFREEAKIIYEHLLKLPSADAALLSNASKNALEIGLIQQAETWSRKATALDPKLIDAWNNLGNALKAQNRWVEAAQTYQSALKINPQFAPAHNNLGLVLKEMGDLDQSLLHLHKAVELAPTYIDTRYNKANLLRMKGEAQEAAVLLKAILTEHPQLAQAHNSLALCLEGMGEAQAALNHWQQAITLQPAGEEAYLNSANLLRKYGQLSDALTILNQALASNLKSAQLLNSVAIVLKEKGELSAALEKFRDAIRALQTRRHTPPHRPKAYMDVKVAHTALLAFKSAMASIGVPFFLAYGTLLGIVRDGDLLPHDKDMDVGLAWDVPRNELIKRLITYGFSIPSTTLRATEADRAWQISVVHVETGIAIDLFFFKPDGRILLSGFNHAGQPLLWSFRAFGLQTIPFLGEQWAAPSPPEQFLEDIYGKNWRAPDIYFDSIISGLNRSPESIDVALCFAYNRLFDRIDRGEWSKAAGYCRQIQAQRYDPFVEEVSDWIELQISEGSSDDRS